MNSRTKVKNRGPLFLTKKGKEWAFHQDSKSAEGRVFDYVVWCRAPSKKQFEAVFPCVRKNINRMTSLDDLVDEYFGSRAAVAKLLAEFAENSNDAGLRSEKISRKQTPRP